MSDALEDLRRVAEESGWAYAVPVRELFATLAASQARVAELEAESAAKDAALNALAGELETTKYQLGNISKQWPELLRDGQRHLTEANEEYARRVSAETALNAMRERTQREMVNLSAEHSWCRLCRTERTGYRGSYAEHPHAPDCVLSLQAVKLTADAQARRDEAVASLGDLLEVLADMDRETHLQKLKWDDRARLRERASVALAKVKP